MSVDPLEVAGWRFEKISEMIKPGQTGPGRESYVKKQGKESCTWPTGKQDSISRTSLFRWYKTCREAPRDRQVEALKPRPRPRPAKPPTIPNEWVEYALALLEEEWERSLYTLGNRIRDRFKLEEAPPKSSLHHALRFHPRYRAVLKKRKGSHKGQRRFQARQPHQIWQADAKAEFTCCFTDGRRVKFRILTIIDDATRYILASLIVLSESLAAAVKVFRLAAARWGLPDAFYCDRGSCYDSDCFRKAIAMLGVRRIKTKPRSPQAHGKVEASHRPLQRWFILELKHQPVVDERHLQQLLDATLAEAYHTHRHASLKMSPAEALQERRSSRMVSVERLYEAFLLKRERVIRKGSIVVATEPYRIPDPFNHQKRIVVYSDPAQDGEPMIRHADGTYQKLRPRISLVDPKSHTTRLESEYPSGSLSPLLERYRGRTLPNACAGFGLPEIYESLSVYMQRRVPAHSREVEIVTRLASLGPFLPQAFHLALEKTSVRLGIGRPLAQVVDDVIGQIKQPSGKGAQHECS